jgi:chorismate-pyruvate lyase
MSYRYLKNWKNERTLAVLNEKTRLSIIDNSPLTNRLMNEKGHNFRVQVLKQASVYHKSFSEIGILNINEIGTYRSVILSTDHYPCISAHTFMPEKYISGKERFLKILGSRSLGTYILKPKRFKKKHVIYKLINNRVHRIAVYKNKRKTIYVNEIFPKNFCLKKISILHARS